MRSPTQESTRLALIAASDPEEMGLFSLPATLQKARCMSHTPLTPPSSPIDSCPSPFKPRSLPILQVTRLVNKRSHATKIQRSRHKVKHLKENATFSEVHRSSSHVDTVEHQTFQQPSIASSNITTEHCNNSKALKPNSTELRRISESYFDLRALAQEQEMEHHLAVPPQSPHNTPLLPSPIIDDRNMKHTIDLSSPFKFDNPREPPIRPVDSNYQSYEDMQILSCYEDVCVAPIVAKQKSMEDNHGHEEAAIRSGAEQPSDESQTFAESGWLANTTSYEQRTRKFNARCYQVVQHPMRRGRSESQGEGQIMLATVLVGPGKPRLVQIKRPSSSNYSIPTGPSVNESADSLRLKQESISTPPSTPITRRIEVSAFSPYDTPSVITPFTEMSGKSRIIEISPSQRTSLTASKLNLVPQPLTLSHGSSPASDEIVDSATDRQLKSLARNFSFGAAIGDDNKLAGNMTTASHDISDSDESCLAEQTIHAMLHGHTRIANNLDAITTAIEQFPNNMLDLDSTAILEIRASPSQRKNDLHLNNLSRVFADAPKQLLNWLAAWIIVDAYVISLQATLPDPSLLSIPLESTGELQRPSIPNRYASLGIPKAKLKAPRMPIYSLFPRPPVKLYKHRRRSPSTSVSSSNNAQLRSVPSKARSLLGIDEDRTRYSDKQIASTRATALSLSIGVVAQKLMELLRAEIGWDPYLWKALVVVVSTVERTNSG